LTLSGGTRAKHRPSPPNEPCSRTRADASFSRIDFSSFDSTDLLLKRDQPVHDRLWTGRTTRNINIDGEDLIHSADHGVIRSAGECAAAARAGSYGDDIF